MIGISLVCMGCNKPAIVDTANWSKPEVISKSKDSTISGFSVHKWNKSLVAMNNDSGPLLMYFPQMEEKSWKETTSLSADWLPLNVDPLENRLVSCKGSLLGDNLAVRFITGIVNGSGEITASVEHTWKADKATFFATTETNISFEAWNSGPVLQSFWGGAFSGSEIFIPYCISGATIVNGGVLGAAGPFDNGVFFSSDSGTTWQREGIDKAFSRRPYVCKTRQFYYFTAGRTDKNELWFSRKPVDGSAWSSPAAITKQFATWNSAVAEGDTVHACWLNRRHEKIRLDAFNPKRKNYEVAYSHRRDSDANWSKDVILSKGLLYAYDPVMSVEGDNLVVAWSGIEDDKDGHDANWPNDIYYTTSKDGGNTWTNPLKITDGFSSGLTAAEPKVVLVNQEIYLFYIQGKINYKEVSSGMAKLNQPPWPIYYTQRPFPK